MSAAKQKTLVVKIGSSTLVDAHGALDRAYLRALAAQVSAVRAVGWNVIVVSSAAIACGVETLRLPARPADMPGLQAAASVGQGVLAQAYAQAFGAEGIICSLVLLTRHDTARRSAYLHARDALMRLLDLGVVPVVNENDTTSVEEIRFGDNDTLAALVACVVKADMCVLFSDIDGLYDANPATHPDARKIERVGSVTDQMMDAAGGAGSGVGTGGMVTKLRAARVLMVAGIPMVICEGHEPNALARLIRGEAVGTLFETPMQKHEITNYKLWIALGDSPHGALIIDEGARNALVERGKSLLCVGVARVEGAFEAGDIVNVKDESGHVIARGKVNASSDEVDLARGHSTRQMASNRLLAPLAHAPLIHRDEMVVFE